VKVNKKTILAALTLATLIAIPAVKTLGKDKEVTTLTSSNTISVNEEVDPISAAKWTQKARELDKKGSANDPIYLVMNTPGGSIMDGLDFIEALRGLRRPVKTVTIFAASMGFQIVQNASGERLILKNGILMSHRAKGGFDGEFGGQDPSQLGTRYAFWVSRLNELDQQTVDRTNGKQTLQSYQKAYANEMWKTGTQSVNEGYADKVVVAACDASLNGTSKRTAQSMFGIEIKYELSDCPMVTGPLNVSVAIPTNRGLMPASEFEAKAGRFDAYCLQSDDANKLCSLDTSLSVQKINQLADDFIQGYTAKQNKVVYMTITP